MSALTGSSQLEASSQGLSRPGVMVILDIQAPDAAAAGRLRAMGNIVLNI